MSTWEQQRAKRETFTVAVPHTYRTGWGVAVNEIWSGEDEEHIGPIAAIEVEVVHITKANTQIVGGVPCGRSPSMWHPLDSFADVPDLTQDDSHDLRNRWFATQAEALEHAARVRREWDNPLPWQPFAVTS